MSTKTTEAEASPEEETMNDRLFRLSSVPVVIESWTGERPSRQTVYRWRTVGIAGVRLRCTWFAGYWRTSEADLREFFRRVEQRKTAATP